ncbi:MAG TPA: hypothetical protein VKE40_15890 [Gemmataceae bacterium]|nr:hypothetical protein [Gemmataceae bacterium]
MTQLPITLPDLVEIIHACGPVCAEDCQAERLQSILIAQLTMSEPRLATRVRRSDQEQVETLSNYVLAGLELAAIPAA